jgi:hypothetical protein
MSFDERSKGQPRPLPLRESIRSRKSLATGKGRVSERPGWAGEKERVRERSAQPPWLKSVDGDRPRWACPRSSGGLELYFRLSL